MVAGDALDGWAWRVEREVTGAGTAWADAQQAKMKDMEEARSRLEISEELHAELDELTTECLLLEDERVATETRIKELDITLQVEKEQQHARTLAYNTSNSSSCSSGSFSGSGSAASSTMLINLSSHSLAGTSAGSWDLHQQNFDEHVRTYFSTISRRLGLDIDVFHEHYVNGEPVDYVSTMPVTEENCRYRLTFRDLTPDKNRVFTAIIKLAPMLSVIEADPALDPIFLQTLADYQMLMQIVYIWGRNNDKGADFDFFMKILLVHDHVSICASCS
ncbi:unnamed protein product [Amoebophrya sp. A120]|nr:unnamed protein product [Amoebophrya sp. A120]|eukprot:GSA120T00015427001.1